MKYFMALLMALSMNALADNARLNIGLAHDSTDMGGEVGLGYRLFGPVDAELGFMHNHDNEYWMLGLSANQHVTGMLSAHVRGGIHTTQVDGHSTKTIEVESDRDYPRQHGKSGKYECKRYTRCDEPRTETVTVKQSVDDDDQSWYAGVGLQLDPNEQVYMYLRYTYFDLDVSKGNTDKNSEDQVVSAGLGFRF